MTRLAQIESFIKPCAEVISSIIRAEVTVVDEELNRFVNMFNLLRDSGYTLRIIPGTPEENAPVFDFDRGCIVQKAA